MLRNVVQFFGTYTRVTQLRYYNRLLSLPSLPSSWWLVLAASSPAALPRCHGYLSSATQWRGAAGIDARQESCRRSWRTRGSS
ncbi:hypothetical protein BRADI_4g12169v3 [Brachypodium distachyon]|uniref:Uncharacterized protein n=1 Tax=Brachypodium distachyon TaxID=15368 RepID=A0A0Q3L4L8_BRADI|nr:hypothetical protein BRADI_4g12169v3 [Brachypodium distachyon]